METIAPLWLWATFVAIVLVSLFVSFTLDPMLSSVWRDPPEGRFRRVPWLGRLMETIEEVLAEVAGPGEEGEAEAHAEKQRHRQMKRQRESDRAVLARAGTHIHTS